MASVTSAASITHQSACGIRNARQPRERDLQLLVGCFRRLPAQDAIGGRDRGDGRRHAERRPPTDERHVHHGRDEQQEAQNGHPNTQSDPVDEKIGGGADVERAIERRRPARRGSDQGEAREAVGCRGIPGTP